MNSAGCTVSAAEADPAPRALHLDADEEREDDHDQRAGEQDRATRGAPAAGSKNETAIKVITAGTAKMKWRMTK